jgi:Tol biopolymer transport system component
VDQRGLVERAGRGDHDAFTELARGAVTRLDQAARLILRDPELARDAVQEALIRAWRDLPRLRDPDRFDAWLYRLTTNACLDKPISNESWVQWAPDSGHIATVRQVETTGGGCRTTICFTNQLDLVDMSGGVQTVATADRMDFVQFRPPDAHELMYRALVDDKWGLFAMDPDGSNVRALAPPTVPAEMDLSFGGATYSADGSRIFYQHGDAGGCCQLWVMNADGTDAHEFLPLGPAWDGEAVPSPDGTWIAYWHNANDGPAHGVTVVRDDGTGPVIETGPKMSGGAHWVWSPDSTKILTYPNDTETASAWLLDPAGGSWTKVPWGSNGDLDWQRLAPAD